MLAALAYLALVAFRRRLERYWMRTLYAHLVLVPIYAFLVVPGVLGFLVPKMVNTRPDRPVTRPLRPPAAVTDRP